MNEKFIITIGRQLGSGGRIIGEMLAQRFNIAFYDKNLIEKASQRSGVAREFFENADEKVSPVFAGTLFAELFADNFFSNENFFKIESDVIRDIASRESAVVVGRCADYVLRDHPRCINLFITADMDDRVQRLMHYQQLTADKALNLIEKTDKRRAAFYNYYSNKTWGTAATYHLCVNSSTLGIEATVAIVEAFINEKLAK